MSGFAKFIYISFLKNWNFLDKLQRILARPDCLQSNLMLARVIHRRTNCDLAGHGIILNKGNYYLFGMVFMLDDVLPSYSEIAGRV
jgi:hypothetical protein